MRWQTLGPGGGGSLFNPTVSPHDARLVVQSCDMTGSYVSTDAGRSWHDFHLRGETQFFAFDPADPDTIWCGQNWSGLWRSHDRGQMWDLVWPRPEGIERVAARPEPILNDHAALDYIVDGSSAPNVTAFAVDPRDNRHLWLGVADKSTGVAELLHSGNAGKTWRPCGSVGAERIISLLVDPNFSGVRVAVLTARQSWVLEDGSLTACPGTSTPGDITHAMGGADASGTRLWRATKRSILTSVDFGRTWIETPLAGAGYEVHSLGVAPGHPAVAYVAFVNLVDGGSDAPAEGVARTRDGGKTWTVVKRDTPRAAAPNADDDWITPAFGPDWGGSPHGIGVAPSDPDIVHLADYGRAWRSEDGGESWRQVYFARNDDGAVSTTGLEVTTTYGIFHDPFDPDRQLIGAADIAAWLSEDGGRSWVPSHTGVPDRWLNTAYWAVFDPDVRGRVWMTASFSHDLPRNKMWTDRGPHRVARFTGGVVASEDGGRTWRESSDGMRETAPTHIILDPRSPAGRRTLYAAGFGTGVWKSIDDGATWRLHNTGIREAEPLAYQFTVDRDGVLYLVVFRRGYNADTGEYVAGALYRSTDGAGTWHPVPLPEGVDGPTGLHVDPRDPQRLYLSAWRRAGLHPRAGGGVYGSTDGGHSWRPLFDREQWAFDIVAAPDDPDTLYTAGFSSSVWRSTDAGTSWHRLPGFNFKFGQCVIPDPTNPALIYVGTFGGGLWHGPADGDPDDPEDVATPGLRYRDLP